MENKKDKFPCRACGSHNIMLNGRRFRGSQTYQKLICKDCKKESMYNLGKAVESQYKFSIPKLTMQTETPIPAKGLTEDQLRERYDANFIVSEATKKLTPDRFIPEHEFISMCKLPTNAGYRNLFDSGKFDEYRGKAGGTTYWSHPDAIRKMKGEGVLK